MTTKLGTKVTNLKHGDKVIIQGRKGTVGTVGGYAVEYNEDPIEAINREIKLNADTPYRNGLMYWINQEPAVLCGDPGYYEAQKAAWSGAIKLEDGQLAWLDGELLKVKFMGNYSDMVHFIKVEAVN